MKNYKRWLITLIVIISLEILFILLLSVEGYAWFYPEIDTQFAKGFTQEKFAAIKVGMSPGEVTALLGEPLVKEGQCWLYSKDDKFKLWPFAWFRVAVCFDDTNVVNDYYKSLMYD